MAVKVKKFGEELEKESRKKQTLTKAYLKAAVKTSTGETDKYDKPSWTDKKILSGLRLAKSRSHRYKRSK
jgi:hypothetical protein